MSRSRRFLVLARRGPCGAGLHRQDAAAHRRHVARRRVRYLRARHRAPHAQAPAGQAQPHRSEHAGGGQSHRRQLPVQRRQAGRSDLRNAHQRPRDGADHGHGGDQVRRRQVPVDRGTERGHAGVRVHGLQRRQDPRRRGEVQEAPDHGGGGQQHPRAAEDTQAVDRRQREDGARLPRHGGHSRGHEPARGGRRLLAVGVHEDHRPRHAERQGRRPVDPRASTGRFQRSPGEGAAQVHRLHQGRGGHGGVQRVDGPVPLLSARSPLRRRPRPKPSRFCARLSRPRWRTPSSWLSPRRPG